MHQENMSYQAGGVTCIASVCNDTRGPAKKPAVLLVHAFEGRTDAHCLQAKQLAEAGYVGIAIDMYGNGDTASTLEGCLALLRPVKDDRALCRARLLDTLKWAKTLPNVDPSQIAIMGFCFGGMCALDLARAGADIRGAVCIHGIFDAPELECSIKSKVLVLHGYNDPQVPPAGLEGFAQEMDSLSVDWQVHFYSQTKHAFTDPHASEIGPPEFGREYNATSASRAWESSFAFFREVFD